MPAPTTRDCRTTTAVSREFVPQNQRFGEVHVASGMLQRVSALSLLHATISESFEYTVGVGGSLGSSISQVGALFLEFESLVVKAGTMAADRQAEVHLRVMQTWTIVVSATEVLMDRTNQSCASVCEKASTPIRLSEVHPSECGFHQDSTILDTPEVHPSRFWT